MIYFRQLLFTGIAWLNMEHNMWIQVSLKYHLHIHAVVSSVPQELFYFENNAQNKIHEA